MVAIFCAVFAILAISMYLMCKFMNKNKGEESRRGGRRDARDRERHRRERQDDDGVDHLKVRQNNGDNYVRESDNESGSGSAIQKQYRVPLKQGRSPY